MGMKEPPGRKGNEASKGHHRTDQTNKNLENFKRNHPQRGATAAAEKPRLQGGKEGHGKS